MDTLEFFDSSDRKPVGRTGEYVSSIGLGTWSIRDYHKAEEVFMKALTDKGIDNIDTAEMYDSGRAEEFVGKIVRRIGRDRVFVTTKMLPYHLISRDEVLKAGRMSLRRLGLRYVDLFLIHWPNESIPIEHQVRNFEAVYESGIARYIGVSNFSVDELELALTATKKAEIVVDQVHYSVHHRRHVEDSLLGYCVRNNITIQAYTPIERGAVARDRMLIRIAGELGKTPIQVALNYVISHKNVVAIVKTESMGHLEEITGAMGWRLPLEKLIELKRRRG
ncbi:MAG: aldo/keto reductase [Desulfurococcales archaeon]|nr:aldo/keto reductase [Desulfurococcales archaeon]